MGNKKGYNGQNRPKPDQQTQHSRSPFGRKLKTSTGFEYVLIAENVADMRFLDALVTMQDASLPEGERTASTVRAIRYLLGESQKDAFYAHIVQHYGAAGPEAVGQELGEIIASFDQAKKN